MAKKTGIILVIFIIFIMVTSILGYFGGESEEVVKYKDYKFVKVQNGWMGYVNDKKVLLSNNPNELENISLGIKLKDLNSAKKIYLSLNPEDNVVLYNFENILSLLTLAPVRACNEDMPTCENLPLKTCNDAETNVKIILIKKQEKLEYGYTNNCLYIKGNLNEIRKVLDKITLELLE